MGPEVVQPMLIAIVLSMAINPLLIKEGMTPPPGALYDIGFEGMMADLQGVAAGDLHDDRRGLTAVIETLSRLATAPQSGVRRDHLRGGQAGAQPSAELAEGAIGHAGHGRERHGIGEAVGSDLHGAV
mgnify:CR=1 FL=1